MTGKGLIIDLTPLDADHVRARLEWREQDVGGGVIVVEVTVRSMQAASKHEADIKNDARALAVRFARAFADTIQT